MTIKGDRIKQLRKERGLTQFELAKKANISRSYLSDVENNRYNPSIETLNDIAIALGVSLSYFVDSEYIGGNVGAAIIKPQPGEKIASVKVLGTIPAGVPIEAIEDFIDTEEIVIKEHENTEDYFALQVKGESMAPRIMNGDVVVAKKQPCVENNEVAVVLINGYEATLKRIKRSENGITLISDNVSYEPVFFSNEEIETLPIIILGRVWELRRKF